MYITAESKPYLPHKGNEVKIPTDGNKVQVSNTKKYRGKRPQNKPSPDPETETDFHDGCTDLEGYTVDLGPRASEKFAVTIAITWINIQ